jgi:hypothetical protein
MYSTATIPWSALVKPVTYQLRAAEYWINIPRNIYATIPNPQNRRILLRDEQKIINSELIKI